MKTILFIIISTIIFIQNVNADKVIYIWGAKWCQPCVKLKNETSKDAEFKEIISKYAGILEMDLDKFPNTAKLWGVKDIPVYLIVDMSEKDGRLTSKVIARWQITDDNALKSLKSFLKKGLDKTKK